MSQLSSARAEDVSHIDFRARQTATGGESCKERHHELRLRAMSNFEITSCNLLRATPASCPLRFFGAALRDTEQLRPPSDSPAETDDGSDTDDFHAWSRPVISIDEFWSHSWHASILPKVLILLLEYNGFAASAVGTEAAFVGSALFLAGVLPAMVARQEENIDAGRACWGLLLGGLVFVVTLLCWRSGRHVFLDKICISQLNERKKLDGVLGIGAFLKASHCMLVLLDSTYVNRLWCIFELAAFSKLMDNHLDKVLRFIPLPYGLYFMIMFMSGIFGEASRMFVDTHTVNIPLMVVTIVVSSFPTDQLRAYQDLLAKLKGQLEGFSFHASQCYCCSVGHLQPDTGARLPCDREAVRACIDAWFGSSQAFDTMVQRRLFDKFARGRGRRGVTYKQALMMCLPFLWGDMDAVAVEVTQKGWDGALFPSVWMVYRVVIVFPLGIAFTCAMAYRVRRRLNSRFVDALISVGVTIASFTVVAVLHQLLFLFRDMHVAVLFIVLGLLTSWVYSGYDCCRLFRACAPGSPFKVETQLCVDGPADVAFHADASAVGRGVDQLDTTDECESVFSI